MVSNAIRNVKTTTKTKCPRMKCAELKFQSDCEQCNFVFLVPEAFKDTGQSDKHNP